MPRRSPRSRARSRGGRPRAWLGLLAALLAPHVGRGQPALTTTGSIDAGVATLRQPAQPRVTAPTIGGELHADGARIALRATGGATLAASNRWTAQVELGSSWIAAARGRASWELGASASALRYNGAPAATSGSLLAHQHVAVGDHAGLWLGAGGGIVARRSTAAPIGALEAGGWLGASRLRGSLTLSLQRARLDTPVVIIGPNGQPATFRLPTDPLVALDATALATWRTPRLDLTGFAAVRRAPQQHRSLLGSTLATGAWWVAPRTAVTATAGILAADPLRGFPTRRVAMAGVRFRPSAPAAVTARRAAARPLTPAADVTLRDGRRVLRVLAPGATAVDVRGDCTRWQPVALVRAGDWWELPVSVDAGTFHLVLRIDGGAWRPPANLPSVADEFGEQVGLLVVP